MARYGRGALVFLSLAATASACGLSIEGAADPDAGLTDGAITSDGATSDRGSPPDLDGGVVVEAGPPCSLPDAGAGSLCNGVCVDLTRDPLNCGGCGGICKATHTCEGGCVDVAGALSGLRLDLPCLDDPNSEYCDTGAGTKTVTAIIGGTAGKTYKVTIRVRGVVEQKQYSSATSGGATGPSNPTFFVIGGSPDGTNWNNYSLEITDPPLTYRLNEGSSNHDYCDPLDYSATITAKAGSTIKLLAISPDIRSARNRQNNGTPIVVMDVPPYPAPFDGQFVRIDVEGVTTE